MLGTQHLTLILGQGQHMLVIKPRLQVTVLGVLVVELKRDCSFIPQNQAIAIIVGLLVQVVVD